MTVAIEARNVAVSLGGNSILSGVNLSVSRGEVLALVGPNGAGKSTLLAALAGDLRPAVGEVLLFGQPITSYRGLELARLRSVMTQEFGLSFPFTVSEVVAMGRNPWQGTGSEDEDQRQIGEAMRSTDVTHLASRRYPSLSGGEKARASLARVLVQDTEVLLLDEPTAALDLKHQEQVLQLARQRASSGKAVVIVIHDLTLAANYADSITVLSQHQAFGPLPPEQILTSERLTEVYQVPVEVFPHPVTGRPIIQPAR